MSHRVKTLGDLRVLARATRSWYSFPNHQERPLLDEWPGNRAGDANGALEGIQPFDVQKLNLPNSESPKNPYGRRSDVTWRPYLFPLILMEVVFWIKPDNLVTREMQLRIEPITKEKRLK